MRLSLLVAVVACAQEPTLRVDVNLVQVDAIVKDRQGKQVATLTKDDFVVFENGKPREIANFSYIRTISAGSATPTRSAATLPHARQLRRENIERTIALVVDDLKMNFESVHQTRLTLKKFVDEQMAPSDLVAIVSTSGGVSALQQFTNDKRTLHAAIDRIRFRLAPGHGGADPQLQSFNNVEGAVGAMLSRRFAVGTLGALRYIIDGMRTMPGRKSVMLFSDGFTMYRSPGQPAPPVTAADAKRVTDSANRSAVVIYGMDSRGLIYPGLQAQDDIGSMEDDEVRGALDARSAKLGHNQDGIKFLAAETGGIAQYNDNDLSGGLARMLEDQSGYYLIGFHSPSPQRVTLRLKNHPELRLRYRRGSIQNGGEGEVAKTPGAKLLAALNSPFTGNIIELRLSPAFVLTEKGQPAIRALLHIRAPELGFSEAGPDGYRTASLMVVGVTDSTTTDKTFTIRVKDDPGAIERARSSGLVYAFEHEVKKPGPYQLRVAVMDGSTHETGSASSYIEVPDLRKGQVATSGLSMASGDIRTAAESSGPSDQADLSAAIRIFERDKPFSYGWTVYNPKPGLTVQPRLVRDGKVVWTGKASTIVASASRAPAGGVLQLGQKTDPGPYSLEVQLLDGQKVASTQWIDFELR